LAIGGRIDFHVIGHEGATKPKEATAQGARIEPGTFTPQV